LDLVCSSATSPSSYRFHASFCLGLEKVNREKNKRKSPSRFGVAGHYPNWFALRIAVLPWTPFERLSLGTGRRGRTIRVIPCVRRYPAWYGYYLRVDPCTIPNSNRPGHPPLTSRPHWRASSPMDWGSTRIDIAFFLLFLYYSPPSPRLGVSCCFPGTAVYSSCIIASLPHPRHPKAPA
jgi:hypothetical protein